MATDNSPKKFATKNYFTNKKKKGTHSFIKGNKIKKKKKRKSCRSIDVNTISLLPNHSYNRTRSLSQHIYIYIFTANRIDDRYNNGWNFGRRAGREGGGVTECAPSSELLIKLNPMAPLDCIGGGKIIL